MKFPKVEADSVIPPSSPTPLVAPPLHAKGTPWQCPPISLISLPGRKVPASAAGLDTSIRTEGEHATLDRRRRDRHRHGAPFRHALLEVQLASRVVVDLNDVTFMDSAGINALVGAYHRVPPNGELRLIGLRPNVRKVLEITGLLALFPDEPGDLNPCRCSEPGHRETCGRCRRTNSCEASRS